MHVSQSPRSWAKGPRPDAKKKRKKLKSKARRERETDNQYHMKVRYLKRWALFSLAQMAAG
eukprot:5634941-Amphidinium_carterae.1